MTTSLPLYLTRLTLEGIDSRLVKTVERVLPTIHANPSGMGTSESQTVKGTFDVWFEVTPRLYVPNALVYVLHVVDAITNSAAGLALGDLLQPLIDQIEVEVQGTHADGKNTAGDPPDIALLYSDRKGFTTKSLQKPERYVLAKITLDGFTTTFDVITAALVQATGHSAIELSPRLSVDLSVKPAVVVFHNTVKTTNPGDFAQQLANILAANSPDHAPDGVVTVELTADVLRDAPKYKAIAFTDQRFEPCAVSLLLSLNAPYEIIADRVYQIVHERCRINRVTNGEPYPSSVPGLVYCKLDFSFSIPIDPTAAQALADELLAAVLELDPVPEGHAPGAIVRLVTLYGWDRRKRDAGEKFDPNYFAFHKA